MTQVLTYPNLSPNTKTPRPSLGAMWEPIQDEMPEVEAILRRELRSEFPFVDELVRYGCLLGGKRLRPALLLLAAKAVGTVRPEHLTLAAVVEMIHTATLVHDDVLDGAVTRRHLATVNARWDTESSVLLGDFLFTHAFYLASTLDSTFACRRIGHATNLVCEGELRQKGTRGDFGVSEETYLSIIEGKTAELCACSCALGAFFAGGDEAAVDRLDAYGRYLGVAFQIADDVLDIVGDEKVTGKSLGTDLDGHKPTLPLIHSLRSATAAERHQILEMLESPGGVRGDQLQPYFDRYESIEYAREIAWKYADLSRRQFDGLRPNAAIAVLRQLPEFVVSRRA